MRRTLLTVTAAAVAVLALPTAALAATVGFRSPTAGAVVDVPTPIEVQVQRSLGESVTGVEVRLRRPDGTAVGQTIPLECVEEAGCGQIGDLDEVWGAETLTAAARPFTTAAVCNGAYVLETRTQGASTWGAATQVVLSAAPGPVTGFTARATGTTVDLGWTPAAPGDVRYVVQRRTAGGTWADRAELPAGSSTYRETAAEGRYDYRIRTVRGDGSVGGSGVAPCTDTERDLHADGPAQTLTLAPGTSSTGEPTPPASGSSTGDGGDGAGAGTDDDGGTGDASDGEGSSGGGVAPASGGSTGGSGSRVAAPPAPARSDTRARAPELEAAGRGDGEEFFGESAGFDDELAYDGIDPVTGERRSDRAQGAFGGVVDAVTTLDVDLRRILTSVAAGLVMMTLAMHLRRWSRET